ncbi:MAG: guanylate kinase [Bdellovibrionales bacterium]|nr:guanylate kinase [Bdellovibrionales bacterium]
MVKTYRQGMILALIGPAGSGKTTLAECLNEKFPSDVSLSISYTSREKRTGELDGEDYFFVSREDFQQMVDAGEFFEHEEVHGNFYGTPKRNVEDAISSGRDLILDIDIKGALNFKQMYPDNTVIVFIAVPSFELLSSRLRSRGYISESEFKKRVETTKLEYDKILELHNEKSGIDYVLVNDDKIKAEESLIEIRNAEMNRFERINSSIIKQFCSLSS